MAQRNISSDQNTLFGVDPTSVPTPVATEDPRVYRPVKRMIEDWNSKHPRRKVSLRDLFRAKQVFKDERMTIWEVETGLGQSFAVFAKGNPYRQCSVFHKSSDPVANNLDDAKRIGSIRFEQYNR